MLSEASYEDGLTAYKRGDYETALGIWKPLADGGHAEASYRIAEMFEFAEGVSKNHYIVAKYYLIAAEGNVLNAQLRIAGRYEDGHGVIQSWEEALKWYFILQENDDVSNSQRWRAKSKIEVFSSVYLDEPCCKGIIGRAEARAKIWLKKRGEKS